MRIIAGEPKRIEIGKPESAPELSLSLLQEGGEETPAPSLVLQATLVFLVAVKVGLSWWAGVSVACGS